ncbi:MAG: glycoside hydrolase family 15 protein [Acidobacteriota bacterium]
MRDIPVGNGTLLVNFDDKYQIRDVYFPHVGQENHTEGFPFRLGVWAEGEFSWVFEATWTRSLRYMPETLVTDVSLHNTKLAIELSCSDTVASHENIFLRRFRVVNTAESIRPVRIFLHHDFRIYENKVGDTAFYDPATQSLIHYKKHRYFLINTEPHFHSFATGRKAFRDQEGTWRDAEDGVLRGGTITEGSVDSTIALERTLDSGESFEFYYWIAAAGSYDQAADLNRHVLERGPQKYFEQTENYWRAWVNKNEMQLDTLPKAVVDLFKRSLLIIRTQIDNDGAILAANDSDVTERATDHYSYLWTRDGAFIANALDLAGYSHLSSKFYEFCGRIVHRKGYFLQKYNADGTVASGWHAAWDIEGGEVIVPIQEDETALVLWAFWQHYDKYRDIEFANRLYRRLVLACADFMVEFRDPLTKLPLPSWNLWEDRRGIHTFTCATVAAGLTAASNFANLFGDIERAEVYQETAGEIIDAMGTHLYIRDAGRFARSAVIVDGEVRLDPIVDASLFGIFYFGGFSPDDEMTAGTMAAVEEILVSGDGLARFENDGYMRSSPHGQGNIWFICTLWLAEYKIARAKTAEDTRSALRILEWTVENALPSGVLAEQLDPVDLTPVSVSPLTWSHSTFVAAVVHYLEAAKKFEGPA